MPSPVVFSPTVLFPEAEPSDTSDAPPMSSAASALNLCSSAVRAGAKAERVNRNPIRKTRNWFNVLLARTERNLTRTHDACRRGSILSATICFDLFKLCRRGSILSATICFDLFKLCRRGSILSATICFDLFKFPPINVHYRRAVAEEFEIQIVDTSRAFDVVGLGFPFIQSTGGFDFEQIGRAHV